MPKMASKQAPKKFFCVFLKCKFQTDNEDEAHKHYQNNHFKKMSLKNDSVFNDWVKALFSHQAQLFESLSSSSPTFPTLPHQRKSPTLFVGCPVCQKIIHSYDMNSIINRHEIQIKNLLDLDYSQQRKHCNDHLFHKPISCNFKTPDRTCTRQMATYRETVDHFKREHNEDDIEEIKKLIKNTRIKEIDKLLKQCDVKPDRWPNKRTTSEGLESAKKRKTTTTTLIEQDQPRSRLSSERDVLEHSPQPSTSSNISPIQKFSVQPQIICPSPISIKSEKIAMDDVKIPEKVEYDEQELNDKIEEYLAAEESYSRNNLDTSDFFCLFCRWQSQSRREAVVHYSKHLRLHLLCVHCEQKFVNTIHKDAIDAFEAHKDKKKRLSLDNRTDYHVGIKWITRFLDYQSTDIKQDYRRCPIDFCQVCCKIELLKKNVLDNHQAQVISGESIDDHLHRHLRYHPYYECLRCKLTGDSTQVERFQCGQEKDAIKHQAQMHQKVYQPVDFDNLDAILEKKDRISILDKLIKRCKQISADISKLNPNKSFD